PVEPVDVDGRADVAEPAIGTPAPEGRDTRVHAVSRFDERRGGDMGESPTARAEAVRMPSHTRRQELREGFDLRPLEIDREIAEHRVPGRELQLHRGGVPGMEVSGDLGA